MNVRESVIKIANSSGYYVTYEPSEGETELGGNSENCPPACGPDDITPNFGSEDVKEIPENNISKNDSSDATEDIDENKATKTNSSNTMESLEENTSAKNDSTDMEEVDVVHTLSDAILPDSDNITSVQGVTTGHNDNSNIDELNIRDSYGPDSTGCNILDIPDLPEMEAIEKYLFDKDFNPENFRVQENQLIQYLSELEKHENCVCYTPEKTNEQSIQISTSEHVLNKMTVGPNNEAQEFEESEIGWKNVGSSP